MILSKTDFIEYLKCDKNFWLKKRRPDLFVEKELSDYEKRLITQGGEVEKVARRVFPDGVLVEGSLKERVEKTKKLIKEKKVPLYHAAFLTDEGLFAEVDVLDYDEDRDSWLVYEVKSSTKIKEGWDKYHIRDVGFQGEVLKRVGVDVGDLFLIHINNKYIKKGELDPEELFKVKKVTKKADGFDLGNEMDEALKMMGRDGDISFCDCIYKSSSKHCSSFNVLNSDVPERSVHDISRIGEKKLRRLIDRGILDIRDVPDDFNLTANQRRQVEIARRESPKINKESITKKLKGLEYPLYFLDYETYSSAIPIMDGLSPYSHLPFQVSIHVLTEEGDLDHHMYLAESLETAEKGLIDFMKEVIGPKGNLISWYKSFENDRNKEMAKRHPEDKEFLMDLNERTFDLMVPFKKDYLHPKLGGSARLKSVVPVMLDSLSYDGLDVARGTEAMDAWHKLIFNNLSDEEYDKIKKDLIKYCTYDTLSMVKIFKKLISEVVED